MNSIQNLSDLVRAMRRHGSGLAVRDRKALFHTYHAAVLGRDLVDWILTETPIRTRDDAVALAQRLLDVGHIVAAAGKTEFRDDEQAIYTLVDSADDAADAADDDDSDDSTVSPVSPTIASPSREADADGDEMESADSNTELRRSESVESHTTADNTDSGNNADATNDATTTTNDDEDAKDDGNDDTTDNVVTATEADDDTDDPARPSLTEDTTEDDGKDANASTASTASTSTTATTADAASRVNVDSFELIKMVGKGGFGKVLKVRKRDTGRIYAMKVMDKSLFKHSKHVDALLAERDIMLNDCPFLVHLYFSFQTTDKLYFVMDFVGGGDLAFHFDRLGQFTEEVTCFFGAELLLALDFLHGHGIIYRDIKPENILVDDEGHIVLTDFGLSKYIGDHSTGRAMTVCGTASYLAPEVLQIAMESARRKPGGATPERKGYDAKCDIWSLGVVLYEMLSGVNPFEAPSFNEMGARVLRGAIPFTQARLHSQLAVDLIKRILSREPENRPAIAELKKHPWFADINWRDLAVKRVPSPFQVDQNVDNFDKTIIKIDEIVGDRTASRDSKFGGLSYAVPLIVEDPLNDALLSVPSRSKRGVARTQSPAPTLNTSRPNSPSPPASRDEVTTSPVRTVTPGVDSRRGTRHDEDAPVRVKSTTGRDRLAQTMPNPPTAKHLEVEDKLKDF
jgi:serine/threonine protein kinase